MSKINTFEQYHKNPLVLLEGGQFGHMPNIWEDYDLYFNEVRSMISDLFEGEIEAVKEKVDGQALAVSIDDNGEVIFARNKGHVKDWGENALQWKGIAKQFAGRGDLTDAFSFAAKDLCEALSRLPKDIRETRFGQYDARLPKLGGGGMETVRVKRWLNFEIVWPETTNVIPYNHRLIILHNYDAIDVHGNKRDRDFNDFARHIEQDLKRIDQLVQKKFTISTVPLQTIPKPEDYSDWSNSFNSSLNDLLYYTNLTDRNTIGEYYSAVLTSKIYKAAENMHYNITRDVSDMLVRRWLYNEKRPNIKQLIDSIPDDPQNMEATGVFKQWIRDTDKPAMKKPMIDSIIAPMKDIIIDVGVQVMKNMSSFLALDPSGASNNMREAILHIAKQVEASKNPELIKKLDRYLKSIKQRGGFESIAPTEGVTFTYKPRGKKHHVTYKLTGTFTDINQIIGFFKYDRASELNSPVSNNVNDNL